MTPEQQRIAIAEACGWQIFDDQTAIAPANAVKEFGPYGKRTHTDWAFIPDYLNDLNAMNEAESKLTDDEWRVYLGFIMGERVIPKLASMEEFHKAWRATAAQRAEAFLRTIGKLI